jgi:hypothetical protein
MVLIGGGVLVDIGRNILEKSTIITVSKWNRQFWIYQYLPNPTIKVRNSNNAWTQIFIQVYNDETNITP